MALHLKYVNDEPAYVAQQEFVHRHQWKQARGAHYRSVFTWAVLLVLATYTAYKAEIVALFVLFAIYLVVYLATSLPYARIQRRAISEAARSHPSKEVQLLVDEDGLHETAEGIRSFAPWPSVRSFAMYRDVLLVELSAALWAIIPRYALHSGSAPLEALVEELRKRGVSERTTREAA